MYEYWSAEIKLDKRIKTDYVEGDRKVLAKVNFEKNWLNNLDIGKLKYDAVQSSSARDRGLILRARMSRRPSKIVFNFKLKKSKVIKTDSDPLMVITNAEPSKLRTRVSKREFVWNNTGQERLTALMVPAALFSRYEHVLQSDLDQQNVILVGWMSEPHLAGFGPSRMAAQVFASIKVSNQARYITFADVNVAQSRFDGDSKASELIVTNEMERKKTEDEYVLRGFGLTSGDRFFSPQGTSVDNLKTGTLNGFSSGRPIEQFFSICNTEFFGPEWVTSKEDVGLARRILARMKSDKNHVKTVKQEMIKGKKEAYAGRNEPRIEIRGGRGKALSKRKPKKKEWGKGKIKRRKSEFVGLLGKEYIPKLSFRARPSGILSMNSAEEVEFKQRSRKKTKEDSREELRALQEYMKRMQNEDEELQRRIEEEGLLQKSCLWNYLARDVSVLCKYSIKFEDKLINDTLLRKRLFYRRKTRFKKLVGEYFANKDGPKTFVASGVYLAIFLMTWRGIFFNPDKQVFCDRYDFWTDFFTKWGTHQFITEERFPFKSGKTFGEALRLLSLASIILEKVMVIEDFTEDEIGRYKITSSNKVRKLPTDIEQEFAKGDGYLI